MTQHQLQLASEPFNAIVSGAKTVESRLCDAKRKQIAVGDKIIFVNRENSKQTASTRVIGLLYYATFESLFAHNNYKKFGGPSEQWLLNQIHQFYSLDDEQSKGVIGIEFVVLSNV